MFKPKQVLNVALGLLVATSTSFANVFESRSNDTSAASLAAPALSFASSQWIWTPELSSGNAPVGSRALRKNFVPPQGKTPAFLTVAFASDNAATLWVNGNEIATDVAWLTASSYCVSLQDCGCGVLIAFNATNVGGPAGLLVDAVITYTDGSTSSIVSDSSWRVSVGGIPNGFQEQSFDDSTWATAVTEGGNGVAPWGTVALAGTDAQSFTPAQWIWTSEAPSSPGNYPPGARAFRSTLTLPSGLNSATATIFITVDNEYSLYANGVFIGSGTDFSVAQKYVVENIQGPEIVFAVYAVNTATVPNPAGVLASIEVTAVDYIFCGNCTSTEYLVTYTNWLSFPGAPPAGFEQPGFDDSNWTGSAVEGAYGVAPWGKVPVPTTVTTGGTPLPGAPAGSA
jgi:hypothetical protein